MKIKYFPYQPHCYAFGGFEVQMLAAYNAVRKKGTNVELLNSWARDTDFDIAHLWGFGISQWNNIVYSKQAKKKVVVTALLPDFSNISIRARFLISRLLYKSRILNELIPYIDNFTTVNEVEKEYLVKYFNFERDKISVIPNIVSDIYTKNSDDDENLGIENFVLCVGNICVRKNQLNLVRACNEIGMNILLIGNVIEGEERYGELVNTELKKNVNNKWIDKVKENSNFLKTAYKKCILFALISSYENQPISVLEALSMNCKILLGDKPYAHQSFYKDIAKVKPDNLEKIKKGLLAVQNGAITKNDIKNICTEENVGTLYSNVYKNLLLA